jgi:Obg family GTPase CgtA-like protein
MATKAHNKKSSFFPIFLCSTLLAAASAARPKIANYPFTTIGPNLGVCDLGQGTGLVLCDIPGLIRGASDGAGMGLAFLRHVQRCKVLLHVVDGTSLDPIGDFLTINQELEKYDPFLAQKPQVVVLNKMDIPEVRQQADELVAALRQAAGHSRVLTISAATTERVQELMGRLQKFVQAQAVVELPPPPPEIDLSLAGLEYDSDEYKIESDPSYPGQWRVTGQYIEQIARMTHWEYPEAVERFGRQLEALGISRELTQRGAEEGDLVMIDVFDFEFSPDMKNPYIPPDLLLERDGSSRMGMSTSSRRSRRHGRSADKMEPTTSTEEEIRPWRPFRQGGFLDIDVDELDGFGEEEDWETLEYNDIDDDGLEDGSFLDFEEDFLASSEDNDDQL